MTPEGMRRSLDPERLDRYTRTMERDRERMKEVWERLRKEQTVLKEVREGFSKLMSKRTTDIWRMKANMGEQLKGYERKIAAAATEDNQTREARERATKEQEETLSRERPRTATPSFT